MKSRSYTVWSALAILAALTAAACEKASPTRPTDVNTASAEAASVTDARTGATIIAAKPAAPAANAQIPWAQQPITLTVTNGVTTGSAALSYTFEVAGDAGFARKDYSRENVPAGGGTTSLTIDKLGGARSYYWRVQANLPSGPGPYSAVRTFTVGPEVVLGTPTLASPVNNASAFAPLQLAIVNIARTGPAGPIVYKVDVSTNDSFGNIIFSTEVPEQTGGSTTTVTAAINGLTDGTTYFWRAQATDSVNSITTPYSAAAAFKAQSFNINTAKFWDNPPDVAVWEETAKITYVEFTGFSMRVDFDRRTGPGKWEQHIPPGWAGPLQYTLGMCRFVENGWHCSAVVQFWDGRSLDDTSPPSRFWREWWYDGARWGPLATHPPVEGEIVGIFVGSGDLRFRGYTRATCPNVCERSNVQMVPYTEGYALYQF
jgi:hypothetical protein